MAVCWRRSLRLRGKRGADVAIVLLTWRERPFVIYCLGRRKHDPSQWHLVEHVLYSPTAEQVWGEDSVDDLTEGGDARGLVGRKPRAWIISESV
eukprot:151442-Chlamydomonas_euryale.AAC.3